MLIDSLTEIRAHSDIQAGSASQPEGVHSLGICTDAVMEMVVESLPVMGKRIQSMAEHLHVTPRTYLHIRRQKAALVCRR